MNKTHSLAALRLAALRLYVRVFRILRPLSSGFLNLVPGGWIRAPWRPAVAIPSPQPTFSPLGWMENRIRDNGRFEKRPLFHNSFL
jgi:hypothetical protein